MVRLDFPWVKKVVLTSAVGAVFIASINISLDK